MIFQVQNSFSESGEIINSFKIWIILAYFQEHL